MQGRSYRGVRGGPKSFGLPRATLSGVQDFLYNVVHGVWGGGGGQIAYEWPAIMHPRSSKRTRDTYLIVIKVQVGNY